MRNSSLRSALNEIFVQYLTLKSSDGWQSQAKFPFIHVGTPGVYNVTAGEGILASKSVPSLRTISRDLRQRSKSFVPRMDLNCA